MWKLKHRKAMTYTYLTWNLSRAKWYNINMNTNITIITNAFEEAPILGGIRSKDPVITSCAWFEKD